MLSPFRRRRPLRIFLLLALILAITICLHYLQAPFSSRWQEKPKIYVRALKQYVPGYAGERGKEEEEGWVIRANPHARHNPGVVRIPAKAEERVQRKVLREMREREGGVVKDGKKVEEVEMGGEEK